MKSLRNLSFLLALLVLSSCGYHNSMVLNLNQNATQVELSEANFKVIQKVQGSSTATYVLGIGGLSNRSLFGNAQADMFNNANLEGKPRVITNVTQETYYQGIVGLLFFKRTVILTGYVIEFED